MAQANTTSTLDGLFKVVYGEGPINAIPEVAILQSKIKFKQTERIGKSYNFPVILSSEAGVTYLAAAAGVSTLNDSIAAQLKAFRDTLKMGKSVMDDVRSGARY